VSRLRARAILTKYLVQMTVDVVGRGAGVVDPLRHAGLPVMPYSGGEAAANPARFVNRNAEAWWAFREGLEAGLIDLDPEDSVLAAQLQSRKWKHDASQRRIEIESKDKMKERGLPSPDRADAAVMAWYGGGATVNDPGTVLQDDSGTPPTITGDLLTMQT
jgi:hypothetical protein